MSKLVLGLALTFALQGQTPAPEIKDPLGRGNPQSSVYQFLEACHARDYKKALHYLDLRKMPSDRRAKDGPDLARQLEDLLDDTPFTITTLSRNPEGDPSDDLAPTLDRLDTFRVDKETLELQLERIELKPGLHVWVVSAPSVAMIPRAHQLVAETPFEKMLPQAVVTFEIFDTPVWRWVALLAALVLLWFATALLSLAAVKLWPRFEDLTRPLRLCVVLACFYYAMALAPPSTLARLYLDRAVGLMFSLALAWVGAVAIDSVGRDGTRIWTREQMR